MMRDSERTVGELIDRLEVACIGSVDADGYPNMKAMLAPRVREGLRNLYFTTNTSSRRVAQYRNNPRGCVYFCDAARFEGVMLSGTFAVLTDAASRELVWREGDDEYYPLGVTDPDYSVLRFTALSGRYYRDLHSEDFSVSVAD